MSQAPESVLRKVRSLLELAAAGSGATDPERENARAAANRLMARYAITEREVPARDTQVRRPAPPPPPRRSIFTIRVSGLDPAHDFFRASYGFDNSTTSTARGFW